MAETNDIRLTILGCGDAFASGGRNHTSFLLEHENKATLIDCGATTPVALKRAGKSFDEIDTVLISHFHGDHYGGLPYLLLEAAKLLKRKKPLTIVSPPGMRSRLKSLLELLYPSTTDVLEAFEINFISYENGKALDLPSLRLTAYEVEHAAAALPHGLRIETAGKIVAYSGDTSWHDNLPKICDKADLFICECNFFDTETPSHLNYQTLQERIPELQAKKMVLTHLGEEMLKRSTSLQVECLIDGQQLTI